MNVARFWRCVGVRQNTSLLGITMSKRCLDEVRSDSKKICKTSMLRISNDPSEQTKNLSKLKFDFPSGIVDSTLVKSPNDSKEYKIIKLENGLRALLISDVKNILPCSYSLSSETNEDDNSICETDDEPTDSDDDMSTGSVEESERQSKPIQKKEEKLAALALSINVGSFSDPADIQGLAHFLEHMIFMGSEKYPEENAFDSFIKKRGGNDNASTECEYTTFYFECQEKYLHTAVDIFSQLFISPLMKQEAMTREREAMESEYQMSFPSDESRKEQLLSVMSKKGYPASKFLWGNLETLQKNVSDEKLYEEVHKFRRRHYSAHRMTLAIQARFAIDHLEEMIKQAFSQVPNNGLPPEDFSHFTNTFDTPMFRKMYYVKPVKDVNELTLQWALPPMLHLYKSKPCEYVAAVIGHQGKGSLLSYLKKKHWALEIAAGSGHLDYEDNSLYALFSINVTLSEKGLEEMEKVLTAIFSYINLMRKAGPSELFFNELKTIEDASFIFAEEKDPAEYVEELADNMHFYAPEDYIRGPDYYYQYDPKNIQELMDVLTPDDVNIIISSKSANVEFNLEEYWFKTKYSVRDIPDEWKNSWKIQEPHPSLHLPGPNIYITTDFSLLKNASIIPDYPEKILQDELMEIWFRSDVKFLRPSAYLNFYIISPLALSTAENAVMMDLYTRIINKLLIEDLYPAVLADLNTSFYVSDLGVVLKIYGFNQKLHLLVERVAQALVNFNEELTEELFSTVKEELTKSYYNHFIKTDQLANSLRLTLLQQIYWTSIDKHKAIGDITSSMMKAFSSSFLSSFYIKCLVQGNYSTEQAKAVCSSLANICGSSGVGPNALPQVKVRKIPYGEQFIRADGFNNEDKNSVVTNYYQSGPISFWNCSIVDLMLMLMDEPLFDTLRTKEQLGYHVECSLKDTFGILGFTVSVYSQADKFSVDHLNDRIEIFLVSFMNYIKSMPAEELETVKQSLIRQKRSADISLQDEVKRNWSEIVADDYVFDRREKDIECIEKIKRIDLIEWLGDHVQNGSKKHFRKLSIQVAGHAEPSNDMSEGALKDNCKSPHSLKLCDAENFIYDLSEFKRSTDLYPIHRINQKPVS